jgi:hypothetical protein
MSEDPTEYGATPLANNALELGTDLLFEQYKTLREEAVALAGETRNLEVITIGAIAALYAWLATEKIEGPVWWIGPGLAVLGALRASALFIRILQIAEYLRAIEKHWFESKRIPIEAWQRRRKKPKAPLFAIAALVWIAIITGAVLGFSYLPDRKESPPTFKKADNLYIRTEGGAVK